MMTSLFQFCAKWGYRLFLATAFIGLVGGIGFIADSIWQFVLETKPESVRGCLLDDIEATFDKKSLKSVYAQIVKKRNAYSKDISERINQYKQYSEEIDELHQVFRRNIGEIMPIDEALDLFASNKDIPPELRPARSTRKLLLQKIQVRKTLQAWIDEQSKSDLLGDIEVQMDNAKSYIDLGKMMDTEQLEELYRLVATPVKGTPQDPIVKQKAMQEFHERLVPQSKRKTQVIFTRKIAP